jgi:hypothetical protein
MSNLTIPYGSAKGEPIATCSLEALNWAINALSKKLRDDPNHRFARQDKQWLAEAQAVFAARSEGEPLPSPPPPPASMVKVSVGAIREAAKATEALLEARQLGHLIAPAPAVGTLPEGCSIMVSAVVVDVQRETYQMAGTSERGLGKVALNKIASALGVDWDPERSQRLDDGSDPHYCHFQAVGRVRNFDGSWRGIDGHKELDLRDSSVLVEEIRAREAQKKRDATDQKPYKGDGGEKEIRMKRIHILSLCETEARLRAVRSLGLRTGYTEAELAKPFVIAQVSFDGYSEDPQARAHFREGIMANFLGSSRALYGKPEVKQVQQHAPPPPGFSVEDDEQRSYGFDPHVQATGTDGGKW